MQAAEEMQAVLQEKEVVLTEEEIKVIHGFFAKVKSGEISREQLKQISGGMSTNVAIGCGVVGSTVGGAGIGTLICPGIGSLIGALIGAIASGILLGI